MTSPEKDSSERELGTIQVLLDRLTTQRLPYALELKEKVDRGEALSEYDTQFLHGVLDETTGMPSLAAKHPEYQRLVGQLVDLYGEITSKALDNERRRSPH